MNRPKPKPIPTKPCPSCSGKGRVSDMRTRTGMVGCPRCNGRKVVAK